ncbi:NAD(P)/FAD-dependent oxidoreductase [Candidatus Woesearchaeota archaeon]|nr:NAD(P)/FAD-dependent oxidoreductase [Candidatus Woesearchaeota archaeon]
MAKKEVTYDVVIVGGGPAGLTAANNAARRGLKTLLLEAGKKTGGKPHQFYPNKCLEDHPGFPDGITGDDLTLRLWKQAKNAGVKIKKHEEVIDIDSSKRIKIVITPLSKYKTKTVILCTGMQRTPRKLPQLLKYKGKGIHYIVRKPELYKKKNVLVVGGGDSAFDNANCMAKFAKKVTIIVRKDKAKAKASSVKEAKNKKVDILLNTEIKNVKLKNQHPSEVVLINNKTSELKTIKAEDIIVNIGYVTSTDFLRKIGLKPNKDGTVKTSEHMETNIAGIFAAGDIASDVKLVSVACGQAVIAAVNTFKYINAKKWQQKKHIYIPEKKKKVCGK